MEARRSCLAGVLSLVLCLVVTMDTTASTDPGDRPCTFRLLREANVKTGYFPSGGRWLQTDGVEHYQPDVCKYKYPRVPAEFINQCLTKANIKSVLNMGDSIGSRYYGALGRTSGLPCEQIRSEDLGDNKWYPDLNYFTRRMEPGVAKLLTAKFRFCRGCESKLDRCSLNQTGTSTDLYLEHIAHTMILDDSLAIEYPSSFSRALLDQQPWALTMAEVVFRYYLKDKYPDVFLIYLPLVQAKQNIPLERLPLELRYFKGLLKVYFPQKTKFIIMPMYSEFEAPRVNEYWRNRRFEGMLASEKLAEMDRVLYEVFAEDFKNPDSNFYGFLDLFEASRSKESWSADGVHMKTTWYESVTSMFWETYCNSVMMNQF